jgi:hypothetical protein
MTEPGASASPAPPPGKDIGQVPLARVQDEALRLLDLIAGQNLAARLLGGVAVALHRHGPQPAVLRRSYGDIDLAVAARDARGLRNLLAATGYRPNERFNALHGARRLLFYDGPNNRQLDVFVGGFKMCHELDLERRLAMDPRTLSPADLLLTKLQIVELNAKDLSDAASLLLWHDVGSEQAGDVIGGDRLVRVTSQDWGWYTTFTANLARVSEFAAHELPGEHGDGIAGRAAQIAGLLDAAPKGLKWRARARIGRRLPWYELPEEVGGRNGG